MNNGWIKLHRKIIDNGILQKDHNAFIVFISLLLIVDKKTGSCEIGRFQLSELTGLKAITAYKALSRLSKKWKMVTQSSNNRFTKITIINWAKYQDKQKSVTQSGNNAVTTGEQQGNTLQEYKNKEYINNMSHEATDWNLKTEIQKLKSDKKRHIQIIGLWIEQTGLRPINKEQLQSIIKRNVRPAMLLAGYSDEDIKDTITAIKNTDYITKFTIETVTKFIDSVVAAKQNRKPKIIKWEEVVGENGTVAMRPIYQK